MNSRLTYFIIFLFLHCSSYAQSLMDKSRMTLTAGLNTNYAYDLEFSYHRMLLPYLGVGGGIGYFSQWYNEYLPYGETHGRWNSWVLCDSDKKIGKVYLRPSVLLSTPALLKLGKYKISLQGECGVQLLIPYAGVHIDYVNSITYDSKSIYKSTSKGKWLFWNVKGGINLSLHNSAIVLGYGISNLDIYSSRRFINVENVSLSDFYPEKKMTHSLFICLIHAF